MTIQNSEIGNSVDRDEDLEIFDALPRELKTLLWCCETKMEAISAQEMLDRAGSIETVRRELCRLEKLLREHVMYAHHGPDHPAATQFPRPAVLEVLGLTELVANPWWKKPAHAQTGRRIPYLASRSHDFLGSAAAA